MSVSANQRRAAGSAVRTVRVLRVRAASPSPPSTLIHTYTRARVWREHDRDDRPPSATDHDRASKYKLQHTT